MQQLEANREQPVHFPTLVLTRKNSRRSPIRRFLREGAAIGDFEHPDRVVVGTNYKRARAIMREIYRPLFINETPIPERIVARWPTS